MLNPRTLWQQWRNSARLTPRFTLKRRQQQQQQQPPTAENDGLHSSDNLSNEAALRAAASLHNGERHLDSPDQNAQQLHSHSHLESPPSPVPNESDVMITTTPQPMQQLSSSQESYEQGVIIYTLTPPASSPFPPIVSAKRLATDIRSKHHNKRRRGRRYRPCLTDQTNLLQPSMEWRDDTSITPSSTNAYDTTDDESVVGDWKVDATKLSPAERNRHYWQICYGALTTTATTATLSSSWSARRLPPTKSCLSSHKKRRCPSISPLDTAPDHLSPSAQHNDESSSTKRQQKHQIPHASASKSVQFGSLSAAEFEKDEPPASAMKHLADEDARRRYCFHQDDEMSTRELYDTERTKANSRILAAWESEFEDVEDSATKRRRSSGTFNPLLMPYRDDSDDEDTSLDMDEVFEEGSRATATYRSEFRSLDGEDDDSF